MFHFFFFFYLIYLLYTKYYNVNISKKKKKRGNVIMVTIKQYNPRAFRQLSIRRRSYGYLLPAVRGPDRRSALVTDETSWAARVAIPAFYFQTYSPTVSPFSRWAPRARASPSSGYHSAGRRARVVRFFVRSRGVSITFTIDTFIVRSIYI